MNDGAGITCSIELGVGPTISNINNSERERGPSKKQTQEKQRAKSSSQRLPPPSHGSCTLTPKVTVIAMIVCGLATAALTTWPGFLTCERSMSNRELQVLSADDQPNPRPHGLGAQVEASHISSIDKQASISSVAAGPGCNETHNNQHNNDSSSTLMQQLHLLATAPVVHGGEVFLARLLPVLTVDGIQLVARAFLEPFHIAVEMACHPSAARNRPYNASRYREICNTDPRQYSKEWCTFDWGTGKDWCTKFAAEWVIPHIIENSPWAANTNSSRVDAMVVHTEGLCDGPYVHFMPFSSIRF